MNARSRGLVALASILLIGMFVWPIWRIDLGAPQYPEGLGMEILPTHGGDRPAFDVLVDRLRAGHVVPLLADRDLSARGPSPQRPTVSKRSRGRRG
mgnify:CR=1 FL=1